MLRGLDASIVTIMNGCQGTCGKPRPSVARTRMWGRLTGSRGHDKLSLRNPHRAGVLQASIGASPPVLAQVASRQTTSQVTKSRRIAPEAADTEGAEGSRMRKMVDARRCDVLGAVALFLVGAVSVPLARPAFWASMTTDSRYSAGRLSKATWKTTTKKGAKARAKRRMTQSRTISRPNLIKADQSLILAAPFRYDQ